MSKARRWLPRVVLLAAFLALPNTALAVTDHVYAGQASTTTVSGIDGYIRVSGTSMVNGNVNFHATFLNLCVSTTRASPPQ